MPRNNKETATIFMTTCGVGVLLLLGGMAAGIELGPTLFVASFVIGSGFLIVCLESSRRSR